MDKSKLRHTYSTLRQLMSTADVHHKSQEISRRFIAHKHDNAPRHILSYQPISKYREASPLYIEKLYPNAQISHAPLYPIAPVQSLAFDMIIVPVLAGDLRCYRLGYGGGWYDRLLASQPQAIKIGLCYDSCIVEELPNEAHDIPLDIIVTDKRIITHSVE